MVLSVPVVLVNHLVLMALTVPLHLLDQLIQHLLGYQCLQLVLWVPVVLVVPGYLAVLWHQQVLLGQVIHLCQHFLVALDLLVIQADLEFQVTLYHQELHLAQQHHDPLIGLEVQLDLHLPAVLVLLVHHCSLHLLFVLVTLEYPKVLDHQLNPLDPMLLLLQYLQLDLDFLWIHSGPVVLLVHLVLQIQPDLPHL